MPEKFDMPQADGVFRHLPLQCSDRQSHVNADCNADADELGAEQPDGHDDGGSTATAVRPRIAPQRPRVDKMPPWKVLLHNDDHNEVEYVVDTIMVVTPLNEQDAVLRTLEAHHSGVSLLMTTHREHAELVQEQFASRKLTVSIEPDDS